VTIPAATAPAATIPSATIPAATTPFAITHSGAAGQPDRADAIAAAVSGVDGVAALHGGMFGEAATYLPGRRVTGVRLSDDGAEVHITVSYGRGVHRIADAVRIAVAPLVTGSVDVIVEDVELNEHAIT